MVKRRSRWPVFFVGLVAGLNIGRNLASERKVPNLDTWQRAMAKERGELEAAKLAALVRTRFEELMVTRPHFTHLALRIHLEKLILPGLALYQVLLDEHGDQESALEEVQALFGEAFGQFIPGLALLDHLPGGFGLFRWATRRLIKYGFPPEGWQMEWAQDDGEGLAYNVHGCIYLDVLTSYGAPELTPLYCWADDLLFESLPEWISWRRTKTLGRGGDCCDFRWDYVGEAEGDRDT